MTTQRYPQQRLAGLRAHTEQLHRTTVQKLSEAIAVLESRGVPVSAGNLLRECGLAYNVYARNPEALALFRGHSAALTSQGGRASAAPQARDPRPVMERLQEAIADLQRAGQAVSVTNLFRGYGLSYNTIKRHPQALALFREHSTGEQAKQRRQQRAQEQAQDTRKSDPLLRLTKTALVAIIRQDREQYSALEARYRALLAAHTP